MELVAALSVNVPGFPTPRPQVALVAGAQVSLVAAGMVTEPEESDNIKTLAAAVADELEAREERKQKMATLRERFAPKED
jgi:uncharacterized protein YbbK (DUF523 family)